MQMNLNEFRLCPKCGSTDFLDNYPSPNTATCVICSHSIIKIYLTGMREDKIFEQHCSHCKAEGEEDDTLFDNDSVIVFKCNKCGTVDGYFIDEDPIDWRIDFESNDEDYSGITRKIAKEEGTLVIPSADKCRAFVKALKKKEKDPKEQNKKQFELLRKQKTPFLQKIGISEHTIRNATYLVDSCLLKKEAVTPKQVTILFAASIILSEEMQLSRRDISTGHATERNISEIFNVDRKTLRKWKKQIEQERPKTKWGVYIYKQDGSTEFAKIEIPEDIAEVTKIEPSYVGKCCHFLSATSRLHWRIKYRNGAWSDISSEAYEVFKKTYWENKGTLTLQE